MQSNERNAKLNDLTRLRGGSWFSNFDYARAVFRVIGDPGNRNFNIGFRVVIIGNPTKQPQKRATMLKLEYIEPATSAGKEIVVKPEPLRLIKLPTGFGCNEFWLAETPITNAQWCAVMGGTTDKPDYPKVEVSYNDAVEFCAEASEQLGCEVRLPTEFEWCRAVGLEPTRQELDKYAVYAQSKICAVKTKLPNEYGLYDMRGLVWEWLKKEGYENKKYPLRGGSFGDFNDDARAVCRDFFSPASRNIISGFRVVVVGL